MKQFKEYIEELSESYEEAEEHKAAAEAAKNNDYVKMNKDSIAEWSKK